MILKIVPEVTNHILLHLQAITRHSDSCRVQSGTVSNPELAIFVASEQQLRIPELLIVWQLKMGRVSFTELEVALFCVKYKLAIFVALRVLGRCCDRANQLLG